MLRSASLCTQVPALCVCHLCVSHVWVALCAGNGCHRVSQHGRCGAQGAHIGVAHTHKHNEPVAHGFVACLRSTHIQHTPSKHARLCHITSTATQSQQQKITFALQLQLRRDQYLNQQHTPHTSPAVGHHRIHLFSTTYAAMLQPAIPTRGMAVASRVVHAHAPPRRPIVCWETHASCTPLLNTTTSSLSATRTTSRVPQHHRPFTMTQSPNNLHPSAAMADASGHPADLPKPIAPAPVAPAGISRGLWKRIISSTVLGALGAVVIAVGGLPYCLVACLVAYQASQEYFGFITSKGISQGMKPPPPLLCTIISLLCVSFIVWMYATQGAATAMLGVTGFVVLSLQLLLVKTPRFAQLTSSLFGLFYCGMDVG